jgi:hypothetical protein
VADNISHLRFPYRHFDAADDSTTPQIPLASKSAAIPNSNVALLAIHSLFALLVRHAMWLTAL